MKTFLLSTLLLTTGLDAQQRSRGIPAKDQETTNEQAGRIFKALRAVNFDAKEVVYPIYAENERISYGISLGEGRLLAKASEVLGKQALFTATREKKSLSGKVIGTYPDHDLAIIEVTDLKAVAAKWGDASSLSEGAFLAAVRPDGEAQAMGVLSVQERSLKSEDQGFLGVQMDQRATGEGVRVQLVVEGSAAEEVGLRAGDVITMINGEEVKGIYELSTKLRRLKAGEEAEIMFLRAKNVIKVKPTLQPREVANRGNSRRVERMDRMSGSQSRVRGEFRNVIQSDMELESSDAGLPVVDLEGRIVGMVIARAGRISTLILPGDDLEKILREEVTPYEPAPASAEQRRANRGDARRERMRRELELMQERMRNLQFAAFLEELKHLVSPATA